MKKKLALLAALAMAMTMFAACGDTDDDSSSSAPATDDSSSVADDTGDSSSEEEGDASSEDESSDAEDESSDSEGEGDTTDDFVFEGTLYTDGEYPGDWGTPNFVIDNDGNTLNFFSAEYLEPYAETGVQVTIEYTLAEKLDNVTLEMIQYPYYLLGPCNASSWAKVYAEGTGAAEAYITGLPEELDARVSIGGDLKEDFTDPFFIQSDGYFVWNDALGAFPTEPVTFTLTAAGVQYLIDNQAENDDGSVWGGLVFQTYGVNVTSVTLSDIAE